jgi:hypothetical protein
MPLECEDLDPPGKTRFNHRSTVIAGARRAYQAAKDWRVRNRGARNVVTPYICRLDQREFTSR